MEKNTTCCGLKGKSVYNQYGVNIELTTNACLPFPNDENERDEYIKNFFNQSEWKMVLESYTCGNKNHFNKLSLIAFIYLVFLLL